MKNKKSAEKPGKSGRVVGLEMLDGTVIPPELAALFGGKMALDMVLSLYERQVVAHEKIADALKDLAAVGKSLDLEVKLAKEVYGQPLMMIINGFLDTYRANAGGGR
jgi:hypothetical protein